MVISLAGEPNSLREQESFREIRNAMRRSLKKFTLSPRSSDSEFFNELARANDEDLGGILCHMEKVTIKRMHSLALSKLE